MATSNTAAAIGGLCHLVEAATALSKLVEAPSAGSPCEQMSVSAPYSPVTVVDNPTFTSNSPKNQTAGAAKTVPDLQAAALVPCSKREIFPQRLMSILDDSSLTDVVTWLPNGKSFVIVRPDVFTTDVLPTYLPPMDARRSTKYPSFTRKLNRW